MKKRLFPLLFTFTAKITAHISEIIKKIVTDLKKAGKGFQPDHDCAVIFFGIMLCVLVQMPFKPLFVDNPMPPYGVLSENLRKFWAEIRKIVLRKLIFDPPIYLYRENHRAY